MLHDAVARISIVPVRITGIPKSRGATIPPFGGNVVVFGKLTAASASSLEILDLLSK